MVDRWTCSCRPSSNWLLVPWRKSSATRLRLDWMAVCSRERRIIFFSLLCKLGCAFFHISRIGYYGHDLGSISGREECIILDHSDDGHCNLGIGSLAISIRLLNLLGGPAVCGTRSRRPAFSASLGKGEQQNKRCLRWWPFPCAYIVPCFAQVTSCPKAPSRC